MTSLFTRITHGKYFLFFIGFLTIGSIQSQELVEGQIPSSATYHSNYENFTAPQLEAENALMISANSPEVRATKPKVLQPSIAQVALANKKVSGLVSVLKAQSAVKLKLSDHDNVSLSYNTGTGNIELSSLNDPGLILEQVSASNLSDVLVIQGNSNDNNLMIDERVLDLGIHILYDGGDQRTSHGDELTIVINDGNQRDFISEHYNESSGRILIDNKSSISYTGLEPITIIGAGGTLTMILPNVNNPDVVISNDPTPNQTLVAGSTFEDLSFEGFDLFNLVGGTALDIVSVQGVDPTYDAHLTLSFDSDDDITFQTTPTGIGTGNLIVDSGFLTVSSDISTTGNIDLTAERNALVNNGATISTTDGNLNITGGTSPVAGDIFIGVDINSSNIQATGSGNISITGTGANDGTANDTNGVYIRGASNVQTSTGTIDVTGVASSSGVSFLIGVRLDNPAIIQSADGNITIDGTGGTGTGDLALGVVLLGGTPVQISGSGSVDITGTGGSGSIAHYGILLQTAGITTSGGGISMTGTGGTSVTDGTMAGVVFLAGANVSDSGAGNITLSGFGGTGTGGDRGIIFNNAPGSSVTTNNGDISITGTGGAGTGNANDGAFLSAGASISSTGTGSISLMGTGANTDQNNRGVYILNASTVSSAGGGVDITGLGGGTGANNNNIGIDIVGSSIVEDTSSGNVILDGTGGLGTNLNPGVQVNSGAVRSFDGDVMMTGTGGNGSTFDNDGIRMLGSAIVENSGAGSIFLNGNAGTGTDANQGIRMEQAGTRITTINGGITMNGFG